MCNDQDGCTDVERSDELDSRFLDGFPIRLPRLGLLVAKAFVQDAGTSKSSICGFKSEWKKYISEYPRCLTPQT